MSAFSFMVMPFGRKPTQAEPGRGPAEIDFDALWNKAYYPMLEELGYRPVRADQETGSLIVHQMLERLYFSDLVLVDLSSPNGNVYYELGVRHAASRRGCVLLAADWSRPLFDIAQMRAVRYPLPSGEITDEIAQAVRERVAPQIARMRRADSPVYQVLPGYPSQVDASRAAGARDQVEALADFQSQLRAAGGVPPRQRLARFAALQQQYRGGPAVPAIALGLLRLLVDSVDAGGWQQVLDYIDGLDADVAGESYVLEQRALALGKLGREEEAIAQLEALMAAAGATPEREGLLGGRYRELLRGAGEAGRLNEAAYYRNRAIKHYEQGMALDLNDYYPSSNLPRLYRARAAPGDEARAQRALHLASAACERALKRGTTDEWVRPTLLGVQFDLPDAQRAEELVAEVEREGAGPWKLATTLRSLEESLAQVREEADRLRLAVVLQRLQGVA